MTEKTFKKQIENIKRKHQERQKFLTATFSEISNAELLGELQKRVVEHQTVKLSMCPNQDYISIEGKDGKYIIFIAYLPIEKIGKKEKHGI